MTFQGVASGVRRKAAISICSQALGELFENGVRAVTLSGSEEAVELYRKLCAADTWHLW